MNTTQSRPASAGITVQSNRDHPRRDPAGLDPRPAFDMTGLTDPPWSHHSLKVWDALDGPPRLAGQSSASRSAAKHHKLLQTTREAIEDAGALDRQLKLVGRVDVVACVCRPGFFSDDPAIVPCRNEFLKAVTDMPHLRFVIEVDDPANTVSALPDDWGESGHDKVCLMLRVDSADETALERIEEFKGIPARNKMLNLGPGARHLDLAGKLGGIQWVVADDGPTPSEPAGDPAPEWAAALRDECIGQGIAFLYHRDGEVVELDGTKWWESPFGGKVDLAKPPMKGSKRRATLAAAPAATVGPAVDGEADAQAAGGSDDGSGRLRIDEGTEEHEPGEPPSTVTQSPDEIPVSYPPETLEAPAANPVKARKPWSPQTAVQQGEHEVTAADASSSPAVAAPPNPVDVADVAGSSGAGSPQAVATPALPADKSLESDGDGLQLEDQAVMQAPAAPSTGVGAVKLSPVRVVDEAPVVLTTEVGADICDVERLIDRLEEMPPAAILTSLEDYSGRAAGFAGDAIRTGARALVCAWACGRLLLAAKGKMKHGEFTAWCDTQVSGIMSESTRQRYMRLAEKSGNVRELLAWGPNLRKAYIGLGILPEPEKGAGREDAPPQSCLLLRAITGMRKRLLRFVDSRGQLADPERQQLQAARMELDTLFDRILG